MARNTPLHTRRARNGYTPLPGTMGQIHPGTDITPTKTVQVFEGKSETKVRMPDGSVR